MRRPRQIRSDRAPALRGPRWATGRGIAGAALALLALACSPPEPAAESVLLDGLFGEWTEAATLIDDPSDAPEATVDILSVQALADPWWLYLALDVGNEVSLQALPGTLHLLVDADGDRSTGARRNGMEGVDLIVDLSQTADRPAGGRGAGFSLRAVSDDGATREIERYALGLMAAPTWAAPRFELRLSRLGTDGVPPFDRSIRLEAIYEESGTIVDETDVGSFSFGTRPAAAPSVPDVDTRLAQPSGTYRVLTWNVASSSFTRHEDDFARTLAALRPDVALLDELPGDITIEALEAFFQSPALAALGTWQVVLGESGGVQRAAVAARGHELRPASSMASMPYPEGALPALARSRGGAADSIADVESRRGVSSTGAWVDLDGRSTLFVASDLQSGGWPGSLPDLLRTVQAATINVRVRGEMGSGRAPVVIGGDFNLVGSRTPLFSLVRRLDVDGSDLLPVDPVRLGERTLATWRNRRDLFAPGRLDFILIPDAAMSEAGSFVFATEDLDDATLERLGLERDVTDRISDHLPVVSDLRFGPPAGGEATTDDLRPGA